MPRGPECNSVWSTGRPLQSTWCLILSFILVARVCYEFLYWFNIRCWARLIYLSNQINLIYMSNQASTGWRSEINHYDWRWMKLNIPDRHMMHMFDGGVFLKNVDILRCCYAICSSVDGTLFKCHYTVYLASVWPLVGHCCLWTDKWALSHFWPFMGSHWKQVVGCNLFWKSVPNDDFGAEMWCMKLFIISTDE